MRQFGAILKDSFREAVDGFVIYLMLGLSAVVVLIVGSLSFTPAPPPEAFAKIVPGFSAVFPEKGRSRVFTGSADQYRATDVQPAGGGYALRLGVAAQPNAGPLPGDNGDSFRQAVAAWAKPAEKAGEVEVGGKGKGGRKVDFGVQSASVEEQRAVTDARMAEFIASQFAVQAGMDATVTRVTTNVAEPEYAFDVTTTGGSSVKGWPHTTKIFFGATTLNDETPLGGVLWLIEDVIVSRFGGTLVLLVGMIITAFFIPNMLRKGSVDLLISKPIGRTQLLVYKYVGGLTFVFLLSAFTVGGIWLALAVRSGYWNPDFLWAIPILTFTFAVLYAMSTLVAVVTRSAVAAMLLTVGFAFFLFVVGQIKSGYDDVRAERPDAERSAWVGPVIDTTHDVLPRTRELDVLTRRLISEGTLTPATQRLAVQAAGPPAPLLATFGVSLAHIALMLAAACWWFGRRDN